MGDLRKNRRDCGVTSKRRETTLDDLLYGKRNKRGDWTPNEPSRVAPIFVWP
jgi:hypothetical protein